MTTLIDLNGKRFGKLLVISRAENTNDGKSKWLCQCDCGNQTVVRSIMLRNGSVTSCGCDKREDLTGKRFGRWTVLEKAEKRGRYYYWKCVCDCGAEKEVRERSLLYGTSISCGCYQKETAAKVGTSKRKDLTGMRFGKLVVVDRVGYTKGYHATIWKCQCDCGNTTNVSTENLRSGRCISCGCYRKEAMTKRPNYHGGSETRLYSVWRGMLNRCKNKNVPEYKNYGGRGISVCEEWENFVPFRDWALANGYKDGLSIDRIDNNKGYYPENCHWATAKEQSNNRRSNILLTHNGVAKTATQWGEELGISSSVILKRKRKGWSDDECLLVPVVKHSNENTVQNNLERYRREKKP